MKLIIRLFKKIQGDWLPFNMSLSVFGFALVELGIPTLVSNMIDEGVHAK